MSAIDTPIDRALVRPGVIGHAALRAFLAFPIALELPSGNNQPGLLVRIPGRVDPSVSVLADLPALSDWHAYSGFTDPSISTRDKGDSKDDSKAALGLVQYSFLLSNNPSLTAL